MRTTQIAQYALRLTYSQVKGVANPEDFIIETTRDDYSVLFTDKPDVIVVGNSYMDVEPANREKMMSRSALLLAAIGLGLSTFSVRQMILHQTRRF